VVVAVVSDAGRAKRLFAEAYDASAAGFARSADRLVYTYLARPLARALGEAAGPVLDAAVSALPAETLPWSPRLVLGVGRRP
jgi:hypothetical protein